MEYYIIELLRVETFLFLFVECVCGGVSLCMGMVCRVRGVGVCGVCIVRGFCFCFCLINCLFNCLFVVVDDDDVDVVVQAIVKMKKP